MWYSDIRCTSSVEPMTINSAGMMELSTFIGISIQAMKASVSTMLMMEVDIGTMEQLRRPIDMPSTTIRTSSEAGRI